MNKMNESDELEKRLRSWTPRRQSPELDEQLGFETRRAPRRVRALPWLAPAMACALAAFVILNQHGPGRFDEDRDPALLGMILSNQSYAAYLPNSYQPANNRLDNFEWTNGGVSASSMRFVSPGRGNE